MSIDANVQAAQLKAYTDEQNADSSKRQAAVAEQEQGLKQQTYTDRQKAASSAAPYLASPDPVIQQKGLSILAATDPDWAKQMPNLMQNQSYGKEKGQLTAKAEFDSTPGQIANTQAEDRATAKVSSRENALSDKNDRWATEAWRTVTAGQPFKQYQEYQTRQATMLNAVTNPSAYGDIGAVFGYMKTLDPQSVVRESEYATAAQAGSLLTRVQNSISKAENGEMLTPAQRADMARLTNHLGSVYKRNYDDFLKPVLNQAKKRGVDIDLIDPYSVDENGAPQRIEKSATPATNPNAEAEAWLKSNPNDPRAAAIKAKLGIK